MSMAFCSCGVLVDTDEDPDFYPEEGPGACETCRDEIQAEAYAEFIADQQPKHPTTFEEYVAMKGCDTRDAS